MADPALMFFLLAAAVLAVVVACLRLWTVERELRERRTAGPGEPPAVLPAPRPTGTLGEREARALFWSPLSVILIQCGLARETGDADRRIDIIERHACRLRDLLEMQRLPGLGAVREEREMDPAGLLREAADAHAALARERGVRVHVMTEKTPPVRTSPALLGHALRHLVRAAIEAAPRGAGDVTVATGLLPLRGEPTHVAFAVADDGPGIEPVRLARLMDPAAGPRSPELSYAVVDAVALALDAEFTVDSLPGEGTRATLKVPLARASADAATAAPLRRPVTAKA